MRSPLRTLAGLVALTLLLGACSGNVFELAIGDCFDDGDLVVGQVEEVGDVPLVECVVPHDNEVYAVVTVDGEVFPGEKAIQVEADEVCLEAFDPFVGLDYQSSALDFGWLVPTADSWEMGDRVVACFVYRLDLAKVSGTLAGSSI
ncbi:MAG: septum formation family protein [Acidimicrobiia bacterium]